MHTVAIVAQVMQVCLPHMHAARWCALRDVVVSAVNGHALGLVALAVGTPRTTKVRHRVKCVDRLLGNREIPILKRTASIFTLRSRGSG
jgi:hypothetical protein